MSEMIKVEHLGKSFRGPDGDVKKVFDDLNFSVEKNEILGIMGTSGCGKTTLLKILGLMEDFSDGEILWEGEPVKKMGPERKAKLRRTKIGFIFQDYKLLDSLTVEDNILLPLLLEKTEDSDIYEKVRSISQTYGIEDLLKRYPANLSGGEKQRVAICRALINNPDIILADEPTGNLDEEYTEKVMREIKKIRNLFQKTVVIVTHNSYVGSLCDRVMYFKDHKITDDWNKTLAQ